MSDMVDSIENEHLSAKEKRELVIQAGMQVIPYVGSSLATLYYGRKQEIRFKRLEIFCKEFAEEISDLKDKIASPEASRLPTMIALKRPTPDDPPPLPVTLAPREGLANLNLTMLKKFSWVALTASTGMGKTQLARIILECWPCENKFWISLRSISERIDAHINEQLLCIHSILSGDWKLWDGLHGGHISVRNIDESVSALIGLDSLLVIDDLPDLLQDGSLIQRLAVLGTELRKVGGKLITTSQHKLPQEIINVLGSSISLFDVPSMDKEDIETILVNTGAPAGLQKDSIYNFHILKHLSPQSPFVTGCQSVCPRSSIVEQGTAILW